MRVRLLTDRAGYGYYQAAGSIVEVSRAEGMRLVESGQAEPVRAKKENAALAKSENRG